MDTLTSDRKTIEVLEMELQRMHLLLEKGIEMQWCTQRIERLQESLINMTVPIHYIPCGSGVNL